MNLKTISIKSLFLKNPWKIGLTWIGVVMENGLMTILPLLIGYSIDGLLEQNFTPLWLLGKVFFGLIVISVLRRLYDTRVYSQLRVELGLYVDSRHLEETVSVRNARLDMSHELVDFLEISLPLIITASVQVVMSLVILYSFDFSLTVAALVSTLFVVGVYRLFHHSFYKLNQRLNAQMEKQVTVLGGQGNLLCHLKRLKSIEVSLSDRDAALYGLIFLCLILLLIFNLWKSTSIEGVTAGMLFSIVAYTWEYVEAILVLPDTLQQWSRLSGIKNRLNNGALEQ